MFTMLAILTLAAPADDDAFKALAPLTQGEWVFVGKVTSYTPGPTGLSEPPLFTGKLTFEVAETLRGKKPDIAVFGYSIRQKEPPAFPNDQGGYIVAVRRTENAWVIAHITPATKDSLERAKTLAKLPAGWTISGGKPVSPWAGLANGGWPKDAPQPAGVLCSKSGRPALLAGDVEFAVEQVIPAQVEKFKNPYGNGQFKVTVTNTTDKPVEVPALLTDGNTVFWDDSIVVIYQSRPLLLAGAGKATGTKPVQLKPGQSVSGVIDTLPVRGVMWPRGGSRVYFDFALGEKVRSNFFYYYSTLHDPLRDAAIKNAGGK